MFRGVLVCDLRVVLRSADELETDRVFSHSLHFDKKRVFGGLTTPNSRNFKFISLIRIKRMKVSLIANLRPKVLLPALSPLAFLTAIGRNCAPLAPKFTDHQHLAASTSASLKKLGVKTQARKYILANLEWVRRGFAAESLRVEISERQRKFAKVREAVKLARMRKLGLA